MGSLDLIRELEGEPKRSAHVDLTLARIVKNDTCKLTIISVPIRQSTPPCSGLVVIVTDHFTPSARPSSPLGCMLSVLFALG